MVIFLNFSSTFINRALIKPIFSFLSNYIIFYV